MISVDLLFTILIPLQCPRMLTFMYNILGHYCPEALDMFVLIGRIGKDLKVGESFPTALGNGYGVVLTKCTSREAVFISCTSCCFS